MRAAIRKSLSPWAARVRALWQLAQEGYVAQSIAVGIGVLLVSLVIYILFLAFWPWKWAYYDVSGQVDPANVLSLQLAFGQVFTSFVTLFLASALGYFALMEFHESHIGPILAISASEQNIVVTSDRGMSGQQRTIAIYALNSGPVLATWYQAEIFIPAGILPDHLPFDLGIPNHPIQIMVGAPPHWQIDSGRMGSAWTLRFSSLGTVAAYPRSPLVLCRILIGTHVFRGYGWRYTITSDRAGPFHGEIQFYPPGALPYSYR